MRTRNILVYLCEKVVYILHVKKQSKPKSNQIKHTHTDKRRKRKRRNTTTTRVRKKNEERTNNAHTSSRVFFYLILFFVVIVRERDLFLVFDIYIFSHRLFLECISYSRFFFLLLLLLVSPIFLSLLCVDFIISIIIIIIICCCAVCAPRSPFLRVYLCAVIKWWNIYKKKEKSICKWVN